MGSRSRTLLVVGILVFFSRTQVRAATLPAYNVWQGNEYTFAIPSIKSVQNLLKKESYLDITSATGFFGAKTKAAVEQYQKDHNLAITGIVGSLTRRLMESEIATGEKKNTDPSLTLAGNFSPLRKNETIKLLDIPLMEQVYPLSCETASLEMALAYKGVQKNQDDLITKIGVATPLTKYKNKNGTTIWGDPNIGFVGDVRGWLFTERGGMAGATGWGVNNGPVAAIAKLFREKSTAQSGTRIEDITKEIDAGNPVIFWRYSPIPNSFKTLAKYQTPAGKEISFISTHVALVVGYKKDTNGAYTLLINDPESGRLEVPAGTFDKTWAGYNRDMVVVR